MGQPIVGEAYAAGAHHRDRRHRPRIFQEFGTDPEIRLAEVSAFLQAPAGRPSVAVERPALQNEERPTGSREGSDDAGSVGG
jgi:hypothetical protein